MFDASPFGLSNDPGELAIAEASAKLKDTIDFVPNGHEVLKTYFTDITLTIVYTTASLGGSPAAIVDILTHLEKIVRDVYGRLEVRL